MIYVPSYKLCELNLNDPYIRPKKKKYAKCIKQYVK